MTDQSQSARERRDELAERKRYKCEATANAAKECFNAGLTDPVVKAMAEALHRIAVNHGMYPVEYLEHIADQALANYNAAVESLNE